MISDLKPYPEMKDSGVPWLANAPQHWEVRRNGRLFTQRNQTGFPSLPILEVSLRTGVRVRDFDGSNRKQVMSDRENYKRVCKGDITYNMMRLWQGAVGVAPVDGLVSPAYVVAQPCPEAGARYFEHVFRTDSYMNEVNKFSRGIVSDRNRLYWEDFKQMWSPFPPLQEQAAIVRFLTHVDQLIRRYVRAKQKLIKLLDEQKQAIVQRAITRGIDPSLRLRPSGVEWLGDVPEHWTLKRFKFLVRVASGQIDPRAPKHRGKILIAPNHIKSGAGRIVLHETAEEQGADSGKYEVLRGQVVYSKIRPKLRKAAIVNVDCLCSADMYPLAVRESEIRPAFLLLLLLSVPFTRFAVDCSLRVAMPKVNREALGGAWLWYPDLKEQDALLQWTYESTAPLDVGIEQAGRHVVLLREFRTRLIADVVTGKLDVREAAAQLPDETDETESLDHVDTPDDSDEAVADAELDAVPEEAEA